MMKERDTADISQDKSSTGSSALIYYIKSSPVRALLRLAFLAMSCSHPSSLETCCEEYRQPAVKTIDVDSGGTALRTLDVFAFETGLLQELDSYQRFDEGTVGETVSIASRTGEKKIYVCANGHWDRNGWANVNSFASLQGIRADLGKESSIHPLMTGSAYIKAGSTEGADISLKRLSCEVTVRDISCDFSGKPYEDEVITDAKVYLTNVNACCSLEPEDHVMPERIINMGRLDEEDLSTMSDPGLIVRSLDSDISTQVVRHDIALRCYPNTSQEESPGSPFTRLVLEGRIGGETYYWPVNVGRSNGEEDGGVRRNRRYIYDLTILSKGSHDPDIPVSSDIMRIETEVLRWREKDNYSIWF